jgi:hypothetical protein
MEERARWQRAHQQFRSELTEFKGQQLQLLGLLAAIVAFIVTAGNIASQTGGVDGIRLIMAASGAIVVVLGTFSLLNNSNVWKSVCREVAEELGLTITSVDIIDTWVYEITPVRHVFIVSYGARYTGDEHPTYSDEHKELGLFAYQEIAGLHMPEPYKITINRWHQRISAAG